ncbi:MAG TPA: substrate-binding domain-containing protein, partial [Candidatus Brocadiia bacterium]|nr:substrate-binding domain-containing protein [Candidatus Brocadiia bacterium]
GGLLERMRAAGLSGGVRYVERDASQLPFLLDSLRGMIRERALGGAWVVNIAPDWAAKISGLLGAYSIPVVHLSRRPAAPLSAALDTPGAIRAGARLLARAGCGRLAMLAFGAERYEDIAESFVATCEALGIDHRTESMPFAPNAELADFERYGHATATRLMSGRNLPDGLLILDDFIGRGALAALLRMGARVPQDVRVCVHARKGDSFPDVFGLPVSRMEADDAAVAESAFDLMEQAVRGEPIAEPHVRRPLKIIPAEAADAAGGAKPFAGVEAGATAQGGDR